MKLLTKNSHISILKLNLGYKINTEPTSMKYEKGEFLFKKTN